MPAKVSPQLALAVENRDLPDFRAFHDAVLRNGALPLPTLRRIILGE